MGRSPTARSRWASRGGEGRTVSPVITRAQKRGQRSGASISTAARLEASCSPSFTATRGERNGAPVSAEISRATPTTESASGRLGVISISRIQSSSPR